MSNPYPPGPEGQPQQPYGSQPPPAGGAWGAAPQQPQAQQPQVPQQPQQPQQGGYQPTSASMPPSSPGSGYQSSAGQPSASQPSADQYGAPAGYGAQGYGGQAAGHAAQEPGYGPAPGGGQFDGGQFGGGQFDGGQFGGGGDQTGGQFGGQPPKKGPNKVVIGTIIGVVILALIGGVGGFLLYQKNQEEKEFARQVETAGQTVQGYFDALVAGDPAKALGFSSEPADGPLVAPEVYKAAAEAAPVGDVTVGEAQVVQDDDKNFVSASVDSSWTVDGQEMSKTWTLSKAGDDWKLDAVTGSVTLADSSLDIVINGAPVEPGTYQALPGKYAVSTGVDAIIYKSESFTVTGPGEEISWLADASISDDAKKKVVDNAKSALDECMSQNDIMNEACPNRFNVDPKFTIDSKTVEFGLLQDPWKDATIVHLEGNQFAIEATFHFTLKAVATNKDDDKKYNITGSGKDGKVWRAISSLDDAKVTWQFVRNA